MAQTLTQGLRKVLATYLTNHPDVPTRAALATLLPGGVHFVVANSQNSTGTGAIDAPYCTIEFLDSPNVRSNNDCSRVATRTLARVIIHGRGRGSTIDDACDQGATLVDTVLEALRATASDSANTAGAAKPVEVRGLYQEDPIDFVTNEGGGLLHVRKGGDYRAFAYYLPS